MMSNPGGGDSVEDRAGRDSNGSRRADSFATLGLAIAAAALLAFVPACSSSSTPTADSTTSSPPSADATSTTSPVTVPEQNPAELATCAADAQTVETALTTYMAGKDSYPSPPAPWSAVSYVSNFGPLTGDADGGPFLQRAPATKFYVIEYDSAGHVWVAPPGTFGPYNKGQDFALQPNICEAAVE